MGQAFKQTSKVRDAILVGLDELKEKLGDIEDYLRIFPIMENITTAVVLLHVSMLKATEDVIGYYTRRIGRKICSLS